ncbi:MAG: sensor histidine kinase [Bacillota bacterium]
MTHIDRKLKGTYNKTKKQKDEYIKNLKVSSLFGLFFGIVFVIVTYITNNNIEATIYFVPVICAVISGLAGLLATFLERLLIKRGLDNALIRKTVIFSIVITLTITLTIIVFTQSDFSSFFQNLQRNMLWGIFFGVLFAVVIAAVEYYNWKVEQKMKILELENKYLEDLAAKDTMLKEATKNLLVSKERNKMARELHDSISQDIHGISFGLTSLKNQINKLEIEDEKISKIISHLEKTAENTSEELKYMIKELKPAALEKNSLKDALVTHCDLFSARQNIVVETDIEDIDKLTPEQEYSIYRIVQEACTNIQKHSQADLVDIYLKTEKDNDQKAFLTIKDNGKGFNIEEIKRGNGLDNMELRTKQVGGNFEVKSKEQKGTIIKAEFPI